MRWRPSCSTSRAAFPLAPACQGAIACLLLPLAAMGQDTAAATPEPAATLPAVAVTATRTEARPIDVPASIDVIDGDTLRAHRAQINLSESLASVPGLQARDRQNYAQDTQISVRGFGARSTFGIRGVRLYVDGIPATLPDGQGQLSNVDLGSAERIEVLRGPFSALYGNSSGGVIQVFTEDGRGAPRIGTSFAAGSDGLWRWGVQASGSTGGEGRAGKEGEGIGYRLSASRFHTDGYRDHSSADRRLGNAKLTWKPGSESKVTLVINSVALPTAQDPLGLSRAQFDANPRGVDPAAQSFSTRKRVNQTQGGLTYERRINIASEIRLMGYLGHRGTEQFQSIPVGTQANPLHPGGVISLGRDYLGTDLRWTHRTRLLDAPLTIVTGLAYDQLDENRRGYQNFLGSPPTPTLGVQGALRRDEKNQVISTDGYLQANWKLTERWTVDAGLRHSRVRFESKDRYIAGPNPDDSGGARFNATLPVLGLMFAVTDDLRLYATAGRGFETPTLNELAYRPGGGTGLNLGLQPAKSDNLEAGIKARLGEAGHWGEGTFALFQTHTEREIVTQTSVGGRATFQNAGATRRRGVELGWNAQLFRHLNAQVAGTWLDASYRDGFTTCAGTPCAVPTQVIPGGNRIPGVARTAAFASLAWMPASGWRGGVEWRALGKVPVNDLNSDAAAGHGLVSLHTGYQWQPSTAWELGAFVRVDNLFDTAYAGSLIVNEGNSRFFEPGPGRTWLGGVSASLRF